MHLKLSGCGIRLIASYESLSLKPYLCPAGKWTIGFGHVILPNESFTTITTLEAEDLLKRDCATAEETVNNSVKVPINQMMFDALCSLTFNIGSKAFKNSTLLNLLNQKLYYEAGKQFVEWVFSNGVILKGLVRRRSEESLIYSIGAYKDSLITLNQICSLCEAWIVPKTG